MSAGGSITEKVSTTSSVKSATESSHTRADSVRSDVSRRSLDNSDVECGQHVEYILVAEFEVDQGPLMEHQYPNAISGDEQ